MYAKKNKDFIIARIRTADPNISNKYYYSYYDAHHINKVLFKTQPELSLLHRMQAKNVKIKKNYFHYYYNFIYLFIILLSILF